jgi:cytochrome P450
VRLVTDVSKADEEDPFELFDRAVGVGQCPDPYPVYQEMLAECPVHAGPQWERFGVQNTMDALFLGDLTPYSVLPYEAVQTTLRDGKTFSSTIMERLNGVVMGHTIIEMDEPEHRLYRALISQSFTPMAIKRWERDIVRPIVDELFDGIVGKGRADLARDVYFHLPARVIVSIFGLPPEDDIDTVYRKAVELIMILADPALGMQASAWLYDYFLGVLERKRKEPSDDLIGTLIRAEVDGHRLTDEEIIAFLRLLLPAGAETTYRSMCNLTVGLLTHPDQLELLHNDRSLVPQAIEEGLRWEPPLTAVSRLVLHDTEVEGTPIPAGSAAQICIGAANHDPSRWDEPLRFDITREPQAHVAFGWGQHVCLGMHLARTEITAAIESLLDRLPNVRLDPDAGEVQITGFGFRGANSLPVLFDPASPPHPA